MQDYDNSISSKSTSPLTNQIAGKGFNSSSMNVPEKISEEKNNLKENGEKSNKIEENKKFDDLKNILIELHYNIKFSKFESKIFSLEGIFENINEINKNKFSKNKEFEGILSFIEEIEEKVKNQYSQKYDFYLVLEIKVNKKKDELNLECLYKVTILNKTLLYKDFDIINNGAYNGFEQLLYYINHAKDETIK